MSDAVFHIFFGDSERRKNVDSEHETREIKSIYIAAFLSVHRVPLRPVLRPGGKVIFVITTDDETDSLLEEYYKGAFVQARAFVDAVVALRRQLRVIREGMNV